MSALERARKRYERVKLLGRGGMASVELAHDVELDRPVAMKRLAENLAADHEFKQRFLREARLAARLSHPNIVGVYDVGEESGRPFIVMEYVEGETVADLLRRRGRLDPQEAVALALQACAGLQAAHAAGLVHRDVKPQNLLVTPSRTVKIADFGIARSVDGTRLTQAGTVLGTAAYLAPEQAAGETVTSAADVYALGAVLYELLTGRPPYTGESLAELFEQQQQGEIPPVRELAPEVPVSVEDAVMHALARDPKYRPVSAADLAAELRAAPAKTRIHQPDLLASPRSRGPLVAALVLGTALVVALVVAFALHGGSKPATGRPPSAAGSPAEQAQSFSTWLRGHAAAR